MAAQTVSVIIPAHNAEHWIATCIESVLAQTRPAHEIIVVDDGSTDHTRERILRYADSIIIVEQQNAGVAAARNAAFERATGEWIAFLDADDYWDAHKLATVLESAERAPESGLWTHDVWVVDERESIVDVYRRARPQDLCIWDRLLARNCIMTSSVVVHAAVARQAGRFRTDLTRRAGCEDWDYWLRVVEHTGWRHIPEPLGYYRRLPGSATRSGLADLLADTLTVIDDAVLRQHAPDDLARRARAHAFYDSAIRRLTAGDAACARVDFRKARELAPHTSGHGVLEIAARLPRPVQSLLLATRRTMRRRRARMLQHRRLNARSL